MTESQMLVIVGIIYIAPHLQRNLSLLVGTLILCYASLKGIFQW